MYNLKKIRNEAVAANKPITISTLVLSRSNELGKLKKMVLRDRAFRELKIRMKDPYPQLSLL